MDDALLLEPLEAEDLVRAESMGMDPRLRIYYRGLGWGFEKGDQFADNFGWAGGNATRMWKYFNITHCPAIVSIGCYDFNRGEIVHRGHWNGRHYGVIRHRR